LYHAFQHVKFKERESDKKAIIQGKQEMILTADKPNYLPAIDYFYKMARADIFVIADDIPYTSGGAINRTSIKSAEGKLGLAVPVLTGGRGKQAIREVKMDPTKNWRQKHWKALQLNYKYAPYYEYYADFFNQLYQKEWQYLIDLNGNIIEFIREALGIRNQLIFSSALKTRSGATEKIVDIVKALGCGKYLSWQGDLSFLDEKQFEREGIELVQLTYQPAEYRQQFGAFISNLSIMDVLFNNGPKTKHLLS
jgi:hypothetical protein